MEAEAVPVTIRRNRLTTKSLAKQLLELFDPVVAITVLFLTLYFQIYILVNSQSGAILAIASLGLISLTNIYISILLTYTIFKKLFLKRKIPSLILCCYLSRYLREKDLRYKFKYSTLIINVGIAITISVLTANEI